MCVISGEAQLGTSRCGTTESTKVDESSFYISPYELNANPISDNNAWGALAEIYTLRKRITMAGMHGLTHCGFEKAKAAS